MNNNLWEVYWEDFKEWSKETLEKGTKEVICKLRDFLQNWGILVSKDNNSIAGELKKVLQENVQSV